VAGVTRRRFVLLSAVALLGAACGAPQPEPGLRGSGTVYRPRELAPITPEPTAAPTRVPPTPIAVPTLQVVPTPEPDLIVPSDALPAVLGASDAEAHVIAVPTRPPAVQPLPAKRLVIPTIGLDTKIIQLGTKLDRRGQIAWETAPFAVGQHKGLAGPGQNGNMVLSGHISSPNEGAIFHHLPDLQVGEGVIVATDERQYLYRVTDIKTVTPDEISVLDQTPDATATLITCVPDGIYSHRLVVTAHLVG
jgi:LPXTG-site transpeptidase (sortase) family protein